MREIDDKQHAARRFRRSLGRPEQPVERDTALDADAELVLLREEVARLKMAQYRPPDVGSAIGRLRLTAAGPDAGAEADEATAAMVEALVLRDSLMLACDELGTALASLQE